MSILVPTPSPPLVDRSSRQQALDVVRYKGAITQYSCGMDSHLQMNTFYCPCVGAGARLSVLRSIVPSWIRVLKWMLRTTLVLCTALIAVSSNTNTKQTSFFEGSSSWSRTYTAIVEWYQRVSKNWPGSPWKSTGHLSPNSEHIRPMGLDSIEWYSQFDNSLFCPKLYLLVFLPITPSDSEYVVVTPPSRIFIALRQ